LSSNQTGVVEPFVSLRRCSLYIRQQDDLARVVLRRVLHHIDRIELNSFVTHRTSKRRLPGLYAAQTANKSKFLSKSKLIISLDLLGFNSPKRAARSQGRLRTTFVSRDQYCAGGDCRNRPNDAST
jgi:hypothetical protein